MAEDRRDERPSSGRRIDGWLAVEKEPQLAYITVGPSPLLSSSTSSTALLAVAGH